MNLYNFTCLLVDSGKELCSSANEPQQNSNASSREHNIPESEEKRMFSQAREEITVVETFQSSLRKHPFLLALRR